MLSIWNRQRSFFSTLRSEGDKSCRACIILHVSWIYSQVWFQVCVSGVQIGLSDGFKLDGILLTPSQLQTRSAYFRYTLPWGFPDGGLLSAWFELAAHLKKPSRGWDTVREDTGNAHLQQYP